MTKSSTSLHGVTLTALKKIPDVRGTIMHGVRNDTLQNDFGEVYFKKLYTGIINGWHIHEKLFLNYLCVLGMIKLVLYDLRKSSPTYKQFQEVYFGDDNYVLIHIPPQIANASEGLFSPFSILCNIASEVHDPSIRYKRIDPHSGKIPYNWTRKNY